MLSKRGFKYNLIKLNHIFSIFSQQTASIFGFARNCSMLCCDVLCQKINGDNSGQGSGNKKINKMQLKSFIAKFNPI